jgi:tryptophanyl-tRNA synthetase
MKKRLLAGVKPTGDIHIGNYFGAIRQMVKSQGDYESFVFIADYHALNQIHNAKELKEGILETAKTYLACGIDPEKTTLFRQSDISEVSELMWILNSVTPMGILQRAHAYKDALAKGKSVVAAVFNYPVLMAADILLYDADVVPVGQDQKQHVEITEDIAQSFNHLYGNIFKIPEPFINANVAIVKGLDGQKMSKSYGNTIKLFETEASLKKKVMSIVTDSKKPDEPKNPETCNIFAFHKLFSGTMLKELEKRYKEGSISYKESKEILSENMKEFLKPIWERKHELDANPALVEKTLVIGAERAREVARKKLTAVKQKIGILS